MSTLDATQPVNLKEEIPAPADPSSSKSPSKVNLNDENLPLTQVIVNSNQATVNPNEEDHDPADLPTTYVSMTYGESDQSEQQPLVQRNEEENHENEPDHDGANTERTARRRRVCCLVSVLSFSFVFHLLSFLS